jgi:hypothetical protein
MAALWVLALIHTKPSIWVGRKDLPIKLILEIGAAKLGDVCMRQHILGPRRIGVRVLHGRRVIGIELSVVKAHHLVIVHGVHV